MVRGLDTFRDHFKGYEDCYILIGGTACDDVFRLSTTLAAADRFELPGQLAADLTKFLGSLQEKDWPAIRSAVGKGRLPDTASVLSRIRDNFGL